MINTDVLIIGGGISGLHTAYQLEKSGISFVLIEARDRLGGRILSANYNLKSRDDNSECNPTYNANKPAYDLGPSWFWPGQSNMETLLQELDLADSVFPQYGNGESLYENQQGDIQKGFHGISMQGIYRMKGGMRQFITELEKRIANNNIKTSTQVNTIEYQDNQIITSFTEKNGSENIASQIGSNKVVIALPPRLAISTIEFKPLLPETRIKELNNYATWMAGHAKFLAIYDKPFWIEQGFSGDALSQLGPIREIHDASSYPNDSDENGYALFGFIGVPASYRRNHKEEIINTATDQLVRFFGKDAAKPMDVVLQDWAQEKYTATEIDQSMNGGHATSSIYNSTESVFNDHLIWSGTETANHRNGTNGLLEGAIEASKRTLNLLL
ncbi:MAG: monoamine oxidase [Cocleimonas sp.]